MPNVSVFVAPAQNDQIKSMYCFKLSVLHSQLKFKNKIQNSPLRRPREHRRHAFSSQNIQSIYHILLHHNKKTQIRQAISEFLKSGTHYAMKSTNASRIGITFEIEAFRGRERNLDEMRMFKLAVSGEIIDHRNSLLGLRRRFGFSPYHSSLGAGFSIVVPFLR